MKITFLIIPIILLFNSCGDDDHKYKHYIYTNIGAVNYVEALPEPVIADEMVYHEEFIIRLEFEHFLIQDSDFSAVDYEPICEDPISKISITSLYDYNDEKPAGESLSEYFIYYYGPDEYVVEGKPIVKHYYISEYTYDSFPVYFDMHLKIPPAVTSTQQFIIETTTVSGESWIDTTNVITIIQ